MEGKIIKAIAGFYYIHTQTAGIYACRARGIFRKDGQKPLVGDNVRFSVLDEAKKEGSLDALLPRKNMLIRPAAANIDQALVVFALRDPVPNLNLLDRFLICMKMQDIPAVILFNKQDLDRDRDAERYQKIYEAAGCRVIIGTVRTDKETSSDTAAKTAVPADGRTASAKNNAVTADGTAILPEEASAAKTAALVRETLRGKTTVLAGPSGVGKSSLTNLLHEGERMEVGALSEKIRRGKQTTRHTELFSLPKLPDTYLLDTPGFTSLLIPELSARDVQAYFPEFRKAAADCRFAGCSHIYEAEALCGVKRAVEAGGISRLRYDNYVQIYEEQKQAERGRRG